METTQEIGLKNKLSNTYAVKGLSQKAVNSVDMTKRIVKGVLNTSYWIDTDLDMIIPGAVSKSLSDNGPQSNANVKIKHQIDHSLKADNTIGRFETLEERDINGYNQLYFESYLPETQASNDHLIKYQSNIYDQHSIGFVYRNLSVAEKDSSTELYRENWNIYYPLALNKAVADKYGYFYVVKEYELFEGSVVTFGANELTPYLGVKSATKETYLLDLFNRLDFLNTINKSKEHKDFKLEIAQIKQIIKETYNREPSIKDTFKKPSAETFNKDVYLKEFLQTLKK